MKEEITLGFCYKGNWIDSIRLDITAFGFVVCCCYCCCFPWKEYFVVLGVLIALGSLFVLVEL